MKYRITCDNCGNDFIVEAKSGQGIDCSCPHCQASMHFTIPVSQEDNGTYVDNKSVPVRKGQKSRKNNPVMLGILIGLLILIILAIFFMITSHFGNTSIGSEPYRGFSQDTVATQPDYFIEEETEQPQAKSDTVFMDYPQDEEIPAETQEEEQQPEIADSIEGQVVE